MFTNTQANEQTNMTDRNTSWWRCNTIILLAPVLSEISWLAFKTLLKTNRVPHNIRGVKMTPASRWCNKIELPVEGLIQTLALDQGKSWSSSLS